MTSMVYTFRLFGANRGKSMTINGHKFVKGEYRIALSGANAANFSRVMGYYAAFAKGTPEYDAAVKAEEATNGAGEVHAAPDERAAEQVHGEDGPDGSGPSHVSADDRSGAVADSEGNSGSGAAGSGHEDAGEPVFEDPSTWPQPHEPALVANDSIKKAVLKLDPENNDHWVATGQQKGKPKLAAVESAYGKAGLTRADLEAALPDWDRDKARGAAQNPSQDEEVDF